ncbi:MAG: D-alanyl-D-alanine carboxypeptidase/D-alanyl-D-alanine endopeptidase [Solirubrobacteraceae bacterium]
MRRSVVFVLLAGLALAPAAAAGRSLDQRLARELARGGGASSGYAVDLTTGSVLLSVRPDVTRPPASVEKLYTSATALERFGPAGRLKTQVSAAAGGVNGGVVQGDLYLRGDGDPTFGAASFDHQAYGMGATIEALASQLATAGITRVGGRVIGDESFLDSRRGEPSSGYAIDPFLTGELSGLAFDRGFANVAGSMLQRDPPLVAANALRNALTRRGVAVVGRATVGITPTAAIPLAGVSSPPIARLVSLMDTPSDNFIAEMLIKDLGARFGGAGTTAAGARVIRSGARRFGARPQVVDGSGLSRSDHSSARMLVQLLAGVQNESIGSFLRSALPLAGRSGTLASRMRGTPADGRCQAKTGTLSDVSSLAGYCRTPAGHDVAFALLYDSVNVDSAHSSQDLIAADLARLG